MQAAIPHGHYKTVTLLADLRLRGLTAARTFDGPIDAALFEDWVETCLVATLLPGEIVVMDNLPAHKGPRVERQNAGIPPAAAALLDRRTSRRV